MRQREICRAFYKAAHIPIAGTSAVATFNRELREGALFLGDAIASRAMNFFPKYS